MSKTCIQICIEIWQGMQFAFLSPLCQCDLFYVWHKKPEWAAALKASCSQKHWVLALIKRQIYMKWRQQGVNLNKVSCSTYVQLYALCSKYALTAETCTSEVTVLHSCGSRPFEYHWIGTASTEEKAYKTCNMQVYGLFIVNIRNHFLSLLCSRNICCPLHSACSLSL